MDLALVKHRLLQGSLVGLARTALAVPIYLVLTPFLLRALGPDLFGIWSFGTIIMSVLALTDFGFKNGLLYFAARERTQPEEVNRYFNAAFFAYIAFVVPAVIAVWLFSPDIAEKLLHVPPAYRMEASFVLVITAIGFGTRLLALPFQSVIEANQEHYYSQLVSLVWLAIYAIGTALALVVRPDVYALGIVTLVSNLAVLVLFVLRTRGSFPFLRIDFRQMDRSKVRALFKYGTGIQVAVIAIAMREPILKILIARTYDLAAVTTFEIVFKLCTQLVSVLATPLLATFATAALLSARESDFADIISRLFRYGLAVFVPASLALWAVAGFLVDLWLGTAHSNVGQLLPAAFFAFAAYYTTEALYKALEGSGRSGYSALVQTCVTAVTVAVFLVAVVGDFKYAISSALVAGFGLFSVINYLMFRSCYPRVHLLTAPQFIGLALPAVGFVGAVVIKPEWVLGCVPFYLVVHAWAARQTGMIDFVSLAKRSVRIVRSSWPAV